MSIQSIICLIIVGREQDHCVKSWHSKTWSWLRRGQWPPPAPEKSINNQFFMLTHLHMPACTLVHSVPAGEQVAHLYTPTDCSNGTRGPNYILMASIFLLASSREQEQNDVFFIFGPSIILLVMAEVSRRHTWTSVGFAYYNKMKSFSSNSLFFLFFLTIITEHGLRLRVLEDSRFSLCDCRVVLWSFKNLISVQNCCLLQV